MPPSAKRSRADSQAPDADAIASDDTLRAATFEAVMEELQTVVTRLEEGELSLEESLVAFELGVKLSREGSRRLEDAERRVDALLASDPTPPEFPSP